MQGKPLFTLKALFCSMAASAVSPRRSFSLSSSSRDSDSSDWMDDRRSCRQKGGLGFRICRARVSGLSMVDACFGT